MSSPKFTQAHPIVNFPDIESGIQRFWRENGIFEKSLKNREGCPKFVFYEGPPTANGIPHNGHVLTRVMKDIFLRYRTMRGYYVPRKAGWDTHGLPVEVEVEKELGIHGKEAIEEYGVERFVLRCMQSVFRYTEEWEDMTNRVGFWVDLSDAYITYHRGYVESVWWALSELFRKGLLYQGHKVVWWWPQGGTALSSGEVGLGYKTVDDPSVYVALPLEDELDTSLLVWTTTPWTLPANQYVAVRPDYDYVQVQEDGRSLVVAAALRETIAEKLGRELPVEKEFKGEALLGRRYRPPLDYFYPRYGNREIELAAGGREPVMWTVLAGDFVELDQGTGLVHEAPAFGEVDYELFRQNAGRYKNPDEVPLLCPVAPDGKFTSEIPDLAGTWVKDADRRIVHALKESGLLVHRENYRHDYPFCWRADDDPLIQYARPAWFIRTTERIQEAIRNNEKVNWLPEHIGTGRFGDFLANNVDWALSRERYWGTPLNIWINDETGKMQAPASVQEIETKNPKAFDHFRRDREANPQLSEHLMVHKPWIDEVTWREPGEPGVYRRVPEVIDAWFDSGCMPFAQFGFPHQGKEQFADAFPADFITEAIDQTRGWFYSQLMISTLLFDGQCQKRLGLEPRNFPHPFRTCIVLGHVTDPSGKKESKSKGNYTPPELIFDRVAQDFAVVTAEDARLDVSDGQVWLSREDIEAMDLVPGAAMNVHRPDRGDDALTLNVQQGKRLPRRLAVLSESDCERLNVAPVSQGVKVLTTEVPRLPDGERVTVESPSSAAPGADAFRWFFFAGNPPWSSTRHSLGNVRTLQKEFPLKLRNVYSFFTIYANIDGFDPPAMQGRPVAERTLLDRWILSELALLTLRVTELMDDYRAYEAAGRLAAFVDGLSNWYLRRSRGRFWKSEFDADKQDAYATLYEALVTTVKLAAPFVPFMAEEIYQNLVARPFGKREAESVHLCDHPRAEESHINRALSDEMAMVRNIVSLGLRVRTDHRLKVRQPLSEAAVYMLDQDFQRRVEPYSDLVKEELNVHRVLFVQTLDHARYLVRPNFRRLGPRLGKRMPQVKKWFASMDSQESLKLASQMWRVQGEGRPHEVEIDGQKVVLEPEDVAFEIAADDVEHYAAAGDRTTVVVLNTELNDQLRDEGLYRELLHRIQNLRKELDVEYTQRIRLSIKGSERLRRILEANKEHFKAETLCVELDNDETTWDGAEHRQFDIEGEEVTISLAPS